MGKVQLPKVDDEIRDELRMMKARRKDKGLSETLNYLIGLEARIKELEDEINTMNAATSDMCSELQRSREY